MPAPLLIPGIMAGAQLLGQGINAVSQGSMNRKTRKWQEAMYARQRADAISDRDYQNWYDSPVEQMRRLKEGGINPRMAFQSGVENTGSVTRSTSMDAWNPRPVEFDMGSVIGAYQNAEVKQAQIDNLKAQNELINMQALWTNYKAAKEGTDLRMTSGADAANLFEELLLTQFDAAKATLNKTKAETKVALDRNEREILSNAQSLAEGVERILTLRQGRELSKQQVESIRRDVDLKNLDINLRKKWNLSPSDPLWIRLITPFLEKFGITP